jgi:hypothetical protein
MGVDRLWTKSPKMAIQSIFEIPFDYGSQDSILPRPIRATEIWTMEKTGR